MDDINWLNDYLKKEEEFNIFYSENVNNVSAVYIYIKNNDIINIKKQKLNVSDNCIKKENILECVNKNKKDNKLVRYLNIILTLHRNKLKSIQLMMIFHS